VLKCVGINFSTTDDDPPFILILYMVPLNWVCIFAFGGRELLRRNITLLLI
jgi:hypothetical protein